MKIKLFFIAIISTLTACGDTVSTKKYTSPDENYGELFKAIHINKLYDDPKAFINSIPKLKAEEIIKLYEKNKTEKDFNLKEFVSNNFIFEKQDTSKPDKTNGIENYIFTLWKSLKREPKDDGGSLIPTRKPYLSAGVLEKEFSYSKSYFAIIGLSEAKNDTAVNDIIQNFSQFIQDFGHVPAGNRSYLMSRSEAPYLSLMIEIAAKRNPQILLNSIPQLTKEYQYWMSSENKDEANNQNEAKKKKLNAYKNIVFLENQNVLNRYFDENNKPRPEAYFADLKLGSNVKSKDIYSQIRASQISGWKAQERWQSTDSQISNLNIMSYLPVDLNALLYHLEKTLAKAYRLKNQKDYAESFEKLAQKRKAIFNDYFWNESKGFYFDYNFITKKQSEVYSLAGMYALFTGIAEPQKIAKIKSTILTKFLHPGGLINYVNPKELNEMGSAEHNWITISALHIYNETELANSIKNRWVKTVTDHYNKSGRFLEIYNVQKVEKNNLDNRIHQRELATASIQYKLMNEKK